MVRCDDVKCCKSGTPKRRPGPWPGRGLAARPWPRMVISALVLAASARAYQKRESSQRASNVQDQPTSNAAATALGQTYVQSKAWTNSPFGCFEGGTGDIYFNTNVGGPGNAVRKLVCKLVSAFRIFMAHIFQHMGQST